MPGFRRAASLPAEPHTPRWPLFTVPGNEPIITQRPTEICGNRPAGADASPDSRKSCRRGRANRYPPQGAYIAVKTVHRIRLQVRVWDSLPSLQAEATTRQETVPRSQFVPVLQAWELNGKRRVKTRPLSLTPSHSVIPAPVL